MFTCGFSYGVTGPAVVRERGGAGVIRDAAGLRGRGLHQGGLRHRHAPGRPACPQVGVRHPHQLHPELRDGPAHRRYAPRPSTHVTQTLNSYPVAAEQAIPSSLLTPLPYLFLDLSMSPPPGCLCPECGCSQHYPMPPTRFPMDPYTQPPSAKYLYAYTFNAFATLHKYVDDFVLNTAAPNTTTTVRAAKGHEGLFAHTSWILRGSFLTTNQKHASWPCLASISIHTDALWLFNGMCRCRWGCFRRRRSIRTTSCSSSRRFWRWSS